MPAHSSFRAGEFDLFLSSQLEEKLSFLSEVVFSSDPTNNFGVDLEPRMVAAVKYFRTEMESMEGGAPKPL